MSSPYEQSSRSSERPPRSTAAYLHIVDTENVLRGLSCLDQARSGGAKTVESLNIEAKPSMGHPRPISDAMAQDYETRCTHWCMCHRKWYDDGIVKFSPRVVGVIGLFDFGANNVAETIARKRSFRYGYASGRRRLVHSAMLGLAAHRV